MTLMSVKASAAKLARLGLGGALLLGASSCAVDAPTVARRGAAASKVTLCHVSPGNPSAAHTITVGEPAVTAHLAHGDHLDACATERPSTCVDPSDPDALAAVGGIPEVGPSQTTICHIPPGNESARHTLLVDNSALETHLDQHGDLLGPCELDEVGGLCTGTDQSGWAGTPADPGSTGAETRAGPFLVVLDPTALDVDHPDVQRAARSRGLEPATLINDGAGISVGNPVVPWSSAFAGDLVTLPAGDALDPGIFAVEADLAGPSGPLALADLEGGLVPQSELAFVDGVRAVTEAQLAHLVGQSLVAVLHDGPVVPLDADSADLSGPRRGLLGLEVLAVDGDGRVTARVTGSSSELGVDSAALAAAGAPDPAPIQCAENYLNVHAGGLPVGCTRLVASDIGRLSPIVVDGATVQLEAWSAASPGSWTGLAYRGGDRPLYVSVLAGGQAHVDDGDGVWLHPDHLAGAPIQSVVFCGCTEGAPGSGMVSYQCGNGALDAFETCDDGNTTDGDGCSSDCAVEAGWVCDGRDCSAAGCGDGIVAGYEECEDDDIGPTSGDGCSDRCRLEPGFVCEGVGEPCRATVCGDGIVEGLEACDDGNYSTADGCSPDCQLIPDCSPGFCYPVCGDGLLFPGEACDDGNLRAGDGCSPSCEVESGFACVVTEEADQDRIAVSTVFRDFLGSDLPGGHPDFQRGPPYRLSTGLVEPTLGPDGVPVFAPDGPGDIASAESFSTWYRDSEYSVTVPGELVLTKTQAGTFELDDSTFFPLDGACPAPAAEGQHCGRTGMGEEPTRTANDGLQHNFHFTTAVRTFFEYRGNEQLNFRGDDDVWVFINGRLAVDVGGVHAAESGSVTLDPPTAADLGLVPGGIYEIAVFHAERQTVASNFRLTLGGFSREMTECSAVCGDAFVTPSEGCDDGVNDGSYGSCMPGCLNFAARCGDGQVDGGYEECDDGNRIDGDGCSASCEVERPCPYDDPSLCNGGPCQSAPDSVDCRGAMEAYCGDNPSDFVCRFPECASGAVTLSACQDALEAYCAQFPTDPNCAQ